MNQMSGIAANTAANAVGLVTPPASASRRQTTAPNSAMSALRNTGTSRSGAAAHRPQPS